MTVPVGLVAAATSPPSAAEVLVVAAGSGFGSESPTLHLGVERLQVGTETIVFLATLQRGANHAVHDVHQLVVVHLGQPEGTTDGDGLGVEDTVGVDGTDRSVVHEVAEVGCVGGFGDDAIGDLAETADA